MADQSQSGSALGRTRAGKLKRCEEQVFTVSAYRYVGGVLGRCGTGGLDCEPLIRKHLLFGGPLVVAIEPDSMFAAYTGGIYHETP